MVAVMAERKESTGQAKVALGVRVAPAVKDRLEKIAEEITAERYPARITAGELAAVAVEEYIERYDKSKRKGGGN